MKFLIPFFALFLSAWTAFAASTRVTVTISGTNNPITGNGLIFSAPAAATRLYTNAATASTILTNATLNGAITNLFYHFAAYPVGSPRLILKWASSNSFQLIGEVDQSISVTTTGFWATLTFSTQSVTTLTTVRVPIASEVGDTNRTNVASLLVLGIGTHSTNSYPTGSVAMAKFVDLTSVQAIKLKDLTNSTVSGSVVTNSILTNSTLGRLNLLQPSATTNAEGLIFYSGATPTTKISSYIGYPTIKGMGTNVYDISVDPDDTYMLNYLSAKKLFPSMFLGRGVDSNYWQTVNIWTGESRFYTSLAATNVSLANVAGTNLTLNGVTTTNTQTYGTNFHNGSTGYNPGYVSSLVNGNNSGIELGTNTIVLLSGASTYCELAGFKIKEGGRVYRLRLEGAATNYIVNFTGSSRSTDAVSGQRIETGTGGDLTLTNNPAWFEVYYDTIHARWQVMSFSR